MAVSAEWREYDVIVAGSGGAGSAAAQAAAEAGARVLVVAKDPVACSDTKIAEGIVTVRGSGDADDSEAALAENLRIAGADLPDPRIAAAFAQDSRDAYDWMRRHGVRPDMESGADGGPDRPRALALPLGGHTRRRSVGHRNGGLAVGHAAWSAVAQNPRVDYLEDAWLLDIAVGGGEVAGGLVYPRGGGGVRRGPCAVGRHRRRRAGHALLPEDRHHARQHRRFLRAGAARRGGSGRHGAGAVPAFLHDPPAGLRRPVRRRAGDGGVSRRPARPRRPGHPRRGDAAHPRRMLRRHRPRGRARPGHRARRLLARPDRQRPAAARRALLRRLPAHFADRRDGDGPPGLGPRGGALPGRCGRSAPARITPWAARWRTPTARRRTARRAASTPPGRRWAACSAPTGSARPR